MSEEQYKFKLGKFMLVTNIGLFVLIFILYALRGFTLDEFFKVLTYLIPIKSVYLTAMVKYVVANKWTPKTPNDNIAELSPFYIFTSNLIIYSHIILISGFIILTAFNLISFDFLINVIPILETFLGIYVGTIISNLFMTKET